MTAPARRLVAFWALLVVLVFLLLEGMALAGLWALARWRHLRYEPVQADLLPQHRAILEKLVDGQVGFIALDGELGWTPDPGSAWNRYRIDPLGLRGETAPATEPKPGRTRIAAFGDSFTFGADVPNVYAFVAQMNRFEPDVEVLNYGVPGFGLGQAFLRYQREGMRLHPEVVLIGFMTENINRVANVFRPFYFSRTGAPMTKPRFALRGDRLILHPNPLPTLEDYRRLLAAPAEVLPEIGRHDYFYHRLLRPGPFDLLPSVRLAKLVKAMRREPVMVRDRYNPASEPYRVTEALFDAFYARVEADGATPVIVLFPARGDINLHRHGGGKRYQALIDHFERRGYRYVDLLECFANNAADVDLRQLARAHYTPIGNLHVARCLLADLRWRGLIPPADAVPPGATPASRRAERDAALAALEASPALADVGPRERRGILLQAERAWDAKIAAAEGRVEAATDAP